MGRNKMENVPGYLQLSAKIREDIQTNYRPGDRYLSQGDLQQRHNVSYCMVNQAMRMLAGEGWIRREHGRGTFVCAVAQKSHRAQAASGTIGILMCRHHREVEYSPFMDDMHKYLIKRANSAGFCVQFLPEKIFYSGNWNKFLDSFLGCDGLICFNPNALSVQQLENIARRRPVVLSEVPVNKCNLPLLSYCSIDTSSGVKMGMQHLIDSGCRRIAMINGNSNEHSIYRQRLSDYRDSLEGAGIEFEPELVCEAADFSSASAAAAMEKLLKQNPDAVFISSSTFGIGALNTILGKNLRIPEDISIVGCDEQIYYAPAFQCLTTVEFPIREFADALVQNVISMIRGEGAILDKFICKPQLQCGLSVKNITI